MEQVFFNLPLSELEPIFKRWIKEAQDELEPKGYNSQNEVEGFLTVEEAATFLTLAQSTIYSKVHKRELPFMKRGKRLYFSQSELLEYIKEGRSQTATEIKLEVNTYLKKGGKNA